MLTKLFFGTVAALTMAVSGVSLSQADATAAKPAATCCKAQDCCQPARACCPDGPCCPTGACCAEQPQPRAACCGPQARGDANTRRSCCAEQRACCAGSGEACCHPAANNSRCCGRSPA